jgi:hypothetical protein
MAFAIVHCHDARASSLPCDQVSYRINSGDHDTYQGMHCLVLSFERENVLRALCPGFAVCRVDMREDMGNAIFELVDGVCIGVKITRSVVLPIEVAVGLKGIVTVNGDEKLDAVGFRFDHELVQAVQHSIIVLGRGTTLERGETVDWCALPGARLALTETSQLRVRAYEPHVDLPSSHTRKTLTPELFRPSKSTVD